MAAASQVFCALKYNSAEHSRDCACHGSRFTERGELIDNPAADGKKTQGDLVDTEEFAKEAYEKVRLFSKMLGVRIEKSVKLWYH